MSLLGRWQQAAGQARYSQAHEQRARDSGVSFSRRLAERTLCSLSSLFLSRRIQPTFNLFVAHYNTSTFSLKSRSPNRIGWTPIRVSAAVRLAAGSGRCYFVRRFMQELGAIEVNCNMRMITILIITAQMTLIFG